MKMVNAYLIEFLFAHLLRRVRMLVGQAAIPEVAVDGLYAGLLIN